MTLDQRFVDILTGFAEYVEEECEEIFFGFLEENFDVFDIIAWYVEYKGSQ